MPQHHDSGHEYAEKVHSGAGMLSTDLVMPPDLAAHAQRVHAQRRTRALLIGADYRLRERVGHPDGGRCQVEAILRAEECQRGQIELDIGNGSRKHQRLPSWISKVSKLVLLLDFCLLLYFFARIADVNWRRPFSANPVAAVALSALLAGLTYGFLAFTGQRMRAHKNHAGTVYLDELDGFTKAALGAAIALAIILAIAMFTWTRVQLSYALGPQAGFTAVIVAAAMGVVNAAANCLVIGVHAVDGSDQVARLNKLSAAVRRSTALAHRMREHAALESRPHCKALED